MRVALLVNAGNGLGAVALEVAVVAGAVAEGLGRHVIEGGLDGGRLLGVAGAVSEPLRPDLLGAVAVGGGRAAHVLLQETHRVLAGASLPHRLRLLVATGPRLLHAKLPLGLTRGCLIRKTTLHFEF